LLIDLHVTSTVFWSVLTHSDVLDQDFTTVGVLNRFLSDLDQDVTLKQSNHIFENM